MGKLSDVFYPPARRDIGTQFVYLRRVELEQEDHLNNKFLSRVYGMIPHKKTDTYKIWLQKLSQTKAKVVLLYRPK